MKKNLSPRDLTKLSAYLDGELNTSASRKMKNRLAHDPNLRAALDDLRDTQAILRRIPSRRAPRNFTLSPQMVAKRPPMPRFVPVLNYASLAAILLFFFSFLGPIGLGGMAAPAPEMMMEASADMAMEEPAAEEPAMEEAPAMAPMPMEAESAVEEPAAEEPSEEMGENLAETVSPTALADDAEEGVQSEKSFAATATVVPAPTIIPTHVVPPPQIESAPLLTNYQRTLLIFLGIFVILGWLLRRAAVSKWQKRSK